MVEEFKAQTRLLEEHYCSLATLCAHKLTLVKTFFTYFLTKWGPGRHVQNWYACVHSFTIGINQGLEGPHNSLD